MQLVLGRRSKTILKGTVFRQRTFIKSLKNRKILKKSAIREEWPNNEVDNDNEYVPSNKRIKKDRGMEQFRKMMAKQDRSKPPSEGMVQLMDNLAASTSTTSLFQVQSSLTMSPLSSVLCPLSFVLCPLSFVLCPLSASPPSTFSPWTSGQCARSTTAPWPASVTPSCGWNTDWIQGFMYITYITTFAGTLPLRF